MMMRAPATVWPFMTARSWSVSFPGLFRISSGTVTLPRSWRSPEMPNARTSAGPRPMDSARAMARMDTFMAWVVVYWS